MFQQLLLKLREPRDALSDALDLVCRPDGLLVTVIEELLRALRVRFVSVLQSHGTQRNKLEQMTQREMQVVDVAAGLCEVGGTN